MPAGVNTNIAVRKVVTAANPAAGAEVLATVPVGKWWDILAVKFVLVTSAAAANRRPALTIDDGTTEFWRWRAGVDQAASLTRTYQFLAQLNVEVDRSTTFNEMYEPLDEGLVLGPGYRIKTVTQALDVADDYGAPVLYVVEYG